MRVINSAAQTQKYLNAARRRGRTIGFVPTMGALHEGHLSLIRRSKKENDITVLSIFVNPLQFGPKEDFSIYPREKKKDVLLAKKENIDIITYPSVKEIYPERFLTYVDVNWMNATLCGALRPGHFRGVTTVVCKLLNLVGPDRLYLGQKDAQQAAVIRQMVRDLNIPVRVTVCPTVREPDGLAMSSRNAYLSRRQRAQATVLYRALTTARAQRRDRLTPGMLTKKLHRIITQNSSGKIDYIACVHPETLEPVQRLRGAVLVALAVKFGKARLIDNMLIRFP